VLIYTLIFVCCAHIAIFLFENSAISLDHDISDTHQAFNCCFRFFFIVFRYQIQFINISESFSEIFESEEIQRNSRGSISRRLDFNKEDELYERDNTTYIYNLI
jgi:hypothetical protein